MAIILSNINRCGGVVNEQIKKGLFLSLPVIFFNRQRYKLECGCLGHFVRQANALLKDEENARDNHILACNFWQIFADLKKKSVADSAINLF